MADYVVDPNRGAAASCAPSSPLIRHAADLGLVRITFVMEIQRRGASNEPIETWKAYAVDERGRYGIAPRGYAFDEVLFAALAELGFTP